MMKTLLNTLYITSPDKYISLDGENIVISEKGSECGRIPLHNLENIITFGFAGASPALMGACALKNIPISFYTANGKFLARTTGKINGNVLLRKEHFKASDSPVLCTDISKNFIIGKLYNQKKVLDRAIRDYSLRIDTDKLHLQSKYIRTSIDDAGSADSNDTLRGIEGKAAAAYFSVFNELILQQKVDFPFNGRNKRPPLDNVNALLSFSYSLLTGMCASALESVGLDPCVGFMHTLRPGRVSLALDIMEELRAPFADRFVLSVINKKEVRKNDFIKQESGAVLLTDDARKNVLKLWQNKKQEIITHPFLNEKMEWGLVPFAQALLLARFLRGDIDSYPPFLWK